MKKQRQEDRYYLQWRMALVFDEAGESAAFHGRTRDLSLYGAAMHTQHHFVSGGSAIVLLAPPPLSATEGQQIIEIRARVVYSVYSCENMSFRVGLQFNEYLNNCRELLQARLSHYTPYFEARPSAPSVQPVSCAP